jgi:hypothetical protein
MMLQFVQDAKAFAERPRRGLPVGVLRRRKEGAPVLGGPGLCEAIAREAGTYRPSRRLSSRSAFSTVNHVPDLLRRHQSGQCGVKLVAPM